MARADAKSHTASYALPDRFAGIWQTAATVRSWALTLP